VAAAYNHATSQRYIAALNQAAQGTADGYGFGAGAGVGYHVALDDDTVLTPRMGLDYAYSHQNGFTEEGAPGADLHITAADQNLLQSSLGATLSTRFTDVFEESGDMLRPEIRAGWLHEWIDPVTRLHESFADVTSPTFTVYGANPGRDVATAGVGFAYVPDAAKTFTVFARYDTLLSASESDHGVTVGLRYSW
jgi:outer membrane autotransporter protein